MVTPRDVDRANDLLSKVRNLREPPAQWTDAQDLSKEPQPEREWVIADFIEKQGRVLLVGPEKSGKSLLGLTLAVQAAAGLPVLDCFPMKEAIRVVYVDLEMGRSSIRRRIRQLCISAGNHLQRGALELYMRPDGVDLVNGKDQAELNTRLAHLQPDLIVLDPLYKMTITDSLYERDIKPTLRVIDKWRLMFGTAIIIIHHLRKQPQGENSRRRGADDMYGSSVLKRWPETLLMLTEDRLRIEFDRDATFGPIHSFPVKRGGTWPMGLEQPRFGLSDEVLEYIQGMGPTSGNRIASDLARRRKDVSDALNELKALGQIAFYDNKWRVTP